MFKYVLIAFILLTGIIIFILSSQNYKKYKNADDASDEKISLKTRFKLQLILGFICLAVCEGLILYANSQM